MGVIINLGSSSKTENQFKNDTLGTVQLLLVISRGLVGGKRGGLHVNSWPKGGGLHVNFYMNKSWEGVYIFFCEQADLKFQVPLVLIVILFSFWD